MRPTLPIIILLLILAASISHVNGSSQQSGYFVNIQPGTSNVSLSVSIFQNLTSLDSSFALPQYHVILTETNSTPFATTIQSALQVKSSMAIVRSLRLEAVSTAWSNTTSAQWLNLSLSFGVSGIALNSNGIEQVDTSWKSFAVPSNMTIGGLEVNNIGSAYLGEIARYISGLANTKLVIFTFHINNQAYSRQRFPVGLVSVLNFSSLAAPLSDWTEGFNSTSNTVYWSSSKLPNLGAVVTETINEATPTKETFELAYSFKKAIISAPLRSSISGDKVIVVFGDTPATLMAITVASASTIAVVTTFYEKRFLLRTPNKRARR